MCNGTQVLVREIENFERWKFERSGVNLLSYIEEKNGTGGSLREIENFERSEFEPSRVTCNYQIHKISFTLDFKHIRYDKVKAPILYLHEINDAQKTEDLGFDGHHAHSAKGYHYPPILLPRLDHF